MILGTMASLVVDVGIFYTARLELQRAADAAALAGAAELEEGGTIADATQQATTFAQANKVTGQVLTASGILAGVAVRLEGPVTFYVTRGFNLAAAVNLLGDTSFDPSNFKVRVLPGGYVNFLAPILVPLRMDLYAPDTDINIAVGISAFKGRIIGKTLDILLPVLGNFTEDQTLKDALDDVSRLALTKP